MPCGRSRDVPPRARVHSKQAVEGKHLRRAVFPSYGPRPPGSAAEAKEEYTVNHRYTRP